MIARVLLCLSIIAASAFPLDVFAQASVGASLDTICAALAPASNPPQQSRPITAKGCAACHGSSTPGLGDVFSGARPTDTNNTDLCINTAPTEASITVPIADGTTVTPGGSVTFTGSGIDPDGFALTYTWSFSDGTTLTGPSVNLPIAVAATAGTTIATLKLTDANGSAASTQPTRSLTVAVTTSGSSAASQHIYVTHYFSNSVTLIETASGNVVATLTVDSPIFGQAVSLDGKYAYLAYVKDGVPFRTVSVIDKDTHTVTANADVVGNNIPYGLAITPDGRFAYTTNFDSPGTVTVADTTTHSVTATVNVGRYPLGVAITPDGNTAYVANYLDGTVSVIGIAGNTVSKTIKVGPYPFRVGNVLSVSAVPFSDFKVTNLVVSKYYGALSLASNFTLGDTSAGFAPTLQTTTLSMGTFALSIPPGGFNQNGWGLFRFNGVFQGVTVDAQIQWLGGNQYALEVYAYHANLIGITNPVTVQLTIGGIVNGNIAGESGAALATPRIFP
jgi:YVTN family beta-propeller protein